MRPNESKGSDSAGWPFLFDARFAYVVAYEPFLTLDE